MSVPTYKYEAHAQWKWHRDGINAWDVPNVQEYETKLTSDFQTLIEAEFAEKMAAAGHWYKITGVTTNFTSGKSSVVYNFPLPTWAVDFTGETILYFESDIQNASAHNSPQLWQIIQDSFAQLIAWAGDHPQVIWTIIGFGVVVWLAIQLINAGTGAVLSIGGNAGALALSIGILAVVGLGIFALFFTGRGKQATSKGYQLGRRAYRKI